METPEKTQENEQITPEIPKDPKEIIEEKEEPKIAVSNMGETLESKIKKTKKVLSEKQLETLRNNGKKANERKKREKEERLAGEKKQKRTNKFLDLLEEPDIVNKLKSLNLVREVKPIEQPQLSAREEAAKQPPLITSTVPLPPKENVYEEYKPPSGKSVNIFKI
jgi:hypothetical protein